MAKAPRPMFREPEPPPPDTTGIDWYASANDIANAVYDATTLDEVDAVAKRHAATLSDLKTYRRDLALTLSAAFQDRRCQLRRQQ